MSVGLLVFKEQLITKHCYFLYADVKFVRTRLNCLLQKRHYISLHSLNLLNICWSVHVLRLQWQNYITKSRSSHRPFLCRTWLRYNLDRRGSIPNTAGPSAVTSRWAQGSSLSYPMNPTVHSSRIKRSGREANHYFHLVQTERMCGAIPPLSQMSVWNGIELSNRDTFTLLLSYSLCKTLLLKLMHKKPITTKKKTFYKLFQMKWIETL
jgi:hypothetical protein